MSTPISHFLNSILMIPKSCLAPWGSKLPAITDRTTNVDLYQWCPTCDLKFKQTLEVLKDSDASHITSPACQVMLSKISTVQTRLYYAVSLLSSAFKITFGKKHEDISSVFSLVSYQIKSLNESVYVGVLPLANILSGFSLFEQMLSSETNWPTALEQLMCYICQSRTFSGAISQTFGSVYT